MIAEVLTVNRFGTIAVNLPRLAHLAARAAVAGTITFVVHGEVLDVRPRSLAGAIDGVAATDLAFPFPEFTLPERAKVLRPFLCCGQLADMDMRHRATQPSS